MDIDIASLQDTSKFQEVIIDNEKLTLRITRIEVGYRIEAFDCRGWNVGRMLVYDSDLEPKDIP